MIQNKGLVEFMLCNQGEILEQTFEHIGLTLISLTISLIIGIALGIFISWNKSLKNFVLGFVSVIQTIPSIALLGFLIPLVGIGPVPAIIALFLYALLPIVRNTCTGIEEVDPSVKEAAKGMGMSNLQILTRIELPLAVPVIFAGIRTATVLSVAIATICAYIASGGLGKFIFRGIALNDTNMILAGAIPAATLAIFFDFSLGIVQKYITQIVKPLIIFLILLVFIIVPFVFIPSLFENSFKAGFVPEFMEREDGYQGLIKCYGLKLKTKELESQLMFQALKDKQVDLISGNFTDGRIKAYKFQILEDDKHFFPPYYAVPVINGKTLRKYPVLRKIFSNIEGKISNKKMAELNYRVENNKESPHEVAKDFLNELGLKTSREDRGKADIIVGSKNFTEQFILAEIFSILIENYSNLNVELKKGLAGTKICFDALKNGEIDLYPEYTGTGFFVILHGGEAPEQRSLQIEELYDFVKQESKKRFDVNWLEPLGFNNTWVLVMREDEAKKFNIKTISDLKKFLEDQAKKD
ncbi:MAG: ABC transporter permease/substrate-binding protein [Candidatus Melainabacteria bacterium]|nr:ABC transporter permease/substrate-binding protein [Candidatus Melainabacteria bacterium]